MRNIGTHATYEVLRNNTLSNDSIQLNVDTILSYVNALKKY